MPRRKAADQQVVAKRATIWDVARLAAVSTATVSRVLRGATTVDVAMAERVRTATEALQYRPNRAASTLASGRAVLTAALVPDLQNTFWMEVTRGIEDVMRRGGYLVALCHWAEDPEVERQYSELLCAEDVAGVIVAPSREQKAVLFEQYGIPVVSVDRRIRNREIDAVLIDHHEAAREAVNHLIANGYRRIGLITGPLGSTTGWERRAGYRAALDDAHIAHDPRIERHGPFTEENGYRGTGELLDEQPPIDALFLANNQISLGALDMLHARGLRVPDDIAVVGFDDAPWVRPWYLSLTHIAQPAYELGSTAAMRLIQRIEQPGKLVRQEIVLGHQLVVGTSSRARGDVVSGMPARAIANSL